jgi:hypothetical protein
MWILLVSASSGLRSKAAVEHSQPFAVDMTNVRGAFAPTMPNVPGKRRGGRVATSALSMSEEAKSIEKLSFRKLLYFFGRLEIDLGAGIKPLEEEFKPSFEGDTSAVGQVQLTMPMGIAFEESGTVRGRFEVTAVGEGSTAEAAGIKPGDLIRGTTALAEDIKGMEQRADEASLDEVFMISAMQSGKKPAFFNADGQSFERLMEAVQTNAAQNGGTGKATLVIERNNPFVD